MTISVAAPQAYGKKANDVIFGANDAAVKAAQKYGKEKVTNATIGAILDENEDLVCLPTVEKVYRGLSMRDVIQYAPIAGLPDFLTEVQNRCFGAYRPAAEIAAVATAGGTGGIHNTIHNYTEWGDEVLTSDWYWGAYSVLCNDNGRKLRTFRLFTDDLQWNQDDFAQHVEAIAERQDQVLVILNTPAHNPTGYSLSDEDWRQALGTLKEVAARPEKHVILLVDVSYLDFAGDEETSRSFFRHFENLPENLLVVVCYSMSKGFTMYGQRIGAMIGITSSPQIAQEFKDINQYTSRATWSNINRAGMQTLVTISQDAKLLQQFQAEQAEYFALIRDRAALFMQEAAEVELPVLPYRAGFFLSVPSRDSKAVCALMNRDNIFPVPLKAGVRLAVCAVTKAKMPGIATKLKAAWEQVEHA